MSEHHVLSLSDRSAAVWEYISPDQLTTPHHVNVNQQHADHRDFLSYGAGEVHKALTIKNMPDSSGGVMSPSTVMVGTFDSSAGMGGMGGMLHGRLGGSQDKGGIGLTSKPQFVLYCISGHKMYAGRLPAYDVSARDNIHLGSNAGSGKEVSSSVIVVCCVSYFILKCVV